MAKMKRRPLRLPFWTPLFILFLLFVAGVWGKTSSGVNSYGLLDLYRQRIYGSHLHKKVNECPGDGMMNFKKSRFGRAMKPFKAFLSWPGKQHQFDKAHKHKPVEDDFYGQEALSKYQHVEHPFDHGEHFNQGSDHFIRDGDHFGANANHFNQDANQFHLNQDRDLDMIGNFQANRPGLVNSPIMDFKREFASDDANPYVESLQQRYEPVPQAYKD